MSIEDFGAAKFKNNLHSHIGFEWNNQMLIFFYFQTERAFQKQPTIPVVRRKNVPGQRKLRTRHYRDVGLGFKTPKDVSIQNFECM